MRAARRGVEAPEELDFLGHYISRGLYFDKVDDGVDSILLTSHTEPIDDYYRHESGVRKTPASKPARATHPVIVALIDELEVTAPLNFAEAIFWLLELGTDGQTSMAEMIESRRRRARDGLITGVRSFFGRTIFVYLAVPSDDLRPLEPYVGAVKYLGRADRAVGICQSAVDRTKLAVSVRYEPWMEDAETARASEELLRNFETRPFKGKAPRVRRG